MGASALRLEALLVGLDEGANVVRHVEQLGPLLLVESHREAAEAVDRYAALFADLERHSSVGGALELRVLGPEALELCGHVIVRHAARIAKCAADDTGACRPGGHCRL